ncbi:hypothetical protein [Dactylosporangium darangshiense]|uniref:Uncharacterized protein n=1 Tax=Dactylosporangium darangshiense TaxID=579108 RepID=A0ABP8DJY2_9ACTN
MDADLVRAVVPYVTAAVAAYGTAVVDRVRDAAVDATADATVGMGRRLLHRILHLDRPDEAADSPVGAAVADLAEQPDDPDRVAALRVQLRKAILADPALAADLASLLPTGPAASGERSVAVQHNSGIVQTGDGAQAWQRQG